MKKFSQREQMAYATIASLEQERDQLRTELAGLRTGYDAYEGVVAGLKAEVEALRKTLTDVCESVQREYWDEYAGLEETRALLDAAMSKEAAQ